MHESGMRLAEHLAFGPGMSLKKKLEISQNMASVYGLSTSDDSVEAPELVDVKHFTGLADPKHRVVKMTKSIYKEDFKENGNLQIGSFLYYQQHENPEIGDSSEASYVLICEREDITLFTVASGGLNSRLFCCYDGEPNPEVIERFGYNDSFEISNLEGFMAEVGKAIHSTYSRRSKCLYSKNKIIQGELSPEYTPGLLDVKLLSTIDPSKYFLKTSQYTHQSEYRFLWNVPENVSDAVIVHCPEAVQHCSF